MVAVIGGVVKDYDWGRIDGLAPWCGGATGLPQAELWFGAHPSGPSPIVSSDAAPVLRDASASLNDETLVEIAEPSDRVDSTVDMRPSRLLDPHGVPLLVKLLAAAQPLSVQVHPRGDLANAWWEAQQVPGAPPVLADANEKTELLVALSPFEAFVGWRPLAQAIEILSVIPAADEAVRLLRAGDRKSAIRLLLALDDLTGSVALLPDAARAAGLAPAESAAYDMVVRVYPGDRGALITALLAHVSLDSGSAVFVPAGVPHSYVQGLGLEVMTTSDNVLRLGLTPKPIFVSEALEALVDEAVPEIIRATIGETITPVGAPFEVRLLGSPSVGAETSDIGDLSEGRQHQQEASELRGSGVARELPTGRFRLCLAIEGSAVITTDHGTIAVEQGTAAVLLPAEPTAMVSGTGLVALVADRSTSS